MSDTNGSSAGLPPAGAADKPVDTVTRRSEPAEKGGIRKFWRRTLRAVFSLGPFAAALTAYSLILDDLPDSWFKYMAIKYLLSAVIALLFGILIRVGAEYALHREALNPTAVVGKIVANDHLVPERTLTTSSPYAVLADTAAALQKDFRSGEHIGTTIFGWSQYFNDPVSPSAIGTSYGLRLAIALDVRNHQINYGRIVNSLIALERPSGGWAASTQREIGRPEATALVLGAAVRGGLDGDKTAEYAKLLERMTADDCAVGKNRTTVLAVVVSTLADIAPESRTLPDLARRLAGGALDAASDRALLSWGETLEPRSGNSVPHTARAVVALKKASRVVPAVRDLSTVAEAGVAWLEQFSSSNLASIDEQLRRPVPGGMVDALLVGHFSAAWTARAFMASDDVAQHQPALRNAMRAVLDSQEHGIWRWHDRRAPMWMTYQGTSSLRDYLMRGMPWPP